MKNLQGNIIRNHESWNVFILTSRTQARIPSFATSVENSNGVCGQCNEARREINSIKIGNHK